MLTIMAHRQRSLHTHVDTHKSTLAEEPIDTQNTAGAQNTQRYTPMLSALAGFLSLDGSCKAFESTADGYVRSEGRDSVVVKQLSDAINNGDYIYALVSDTADNQDGKSFSLTPPLKEQHTDCLKQAALKAGLLRSDNDGKTTTTGTPYIVNHIAMNETHVPGATLIDPIEAYVSSMT